jgi:hypothetical protein
VDAADADGPNRAVGTPRPWRRWPGSQPQGYRHREGHPGKTCRVPLSRLRERLRHAHSPICGFLCRASASTVASWLCPLCPLVPLGSPTEQAVGDDGYVAQAACAAYRVVADVQQVGWLSVLVPGERSIGFVSQTRGAFPARLLHAPIVGLTRTLWVNSEPYETRGSY